MRAAGIDPGRKAPGPFGFWKPRGPKELLGAVSRARGGTWFSLTPASIVLCKCCTLASWLALVTERCSLGRDLGVIIVVLVLPLGREDEVALGFSFMGDRQ